MHDGYAPDICVEFMRIAGGATRRCPKRRSRLLGATIEREDAVRLGAVEVPYVFKRVPRRRHVHLMVNDGGTLEVRAPWRFSLPSAREVLRENAQWVLRTLENAREKLAGRPRLVSGARLPLLDACLRLDVRPRAQIDLFGTARRPRGSVERRGGVLRTSPASLDEGEVRRLLESWYRGAAARHLASRVEHYAPRLGVEPASVAIRGQRTCWGSCSGQGRISLNWRLMMVPGAFADYVVVHELCHLRHMNHSPRFWAMVESAIPDYRQRARGLRALQGSLPL